MLHMFPFEAAPIQWSGERSFPTSAMAHLFISARSVEIEITNPKRARTSDPVGPYPVIGSTKEVGKIARERRWMTREARGTLLKYGAAIQYDHEFKRCFLQHQMNDYKSRTSHTVQLSD